MRFYHPINGCKLSNSNWYLKEFFGTDLERYGNDIICKFCRCLLETHPDYHLEPEGRHIEEESSISIPDFTNSSDDSSSDFSVPDFGSSSGNDDDFSGGGGDFGGGGASSDW